MCFQEEEVPLLSRHKGQKTRTIHDGWTVAPFSVKSQQRFPPYDEKSLGRLWLYSPGNLSSYELFRKAQREGSRCLWMLLGLFIGWCLVFNPITKHLSRSFPSIPSILDVCRWYVHTIDELLLGMHRHFASDSSPRAIHPYHCYCLGRCGWNQAKDGLAGDEQQWWYHAFSIITLQY